MLSKVHHYGVTKQTTAQLDLIVVKIPGEAERLGGIERVLRDFLPAISSGLLNVRHVDLSEEEAASCRELWPSLGQ